MRRMLRMATVRRSEGTWKNRLLIRCLSSSSAAAPNLGYTTKRDILESLHRATRRIPSIVRTGSESQLSLRSKCTAIRLDGTMEPCEPLLKQTLIGFGLQPRDLRSLDGNVIDSRPSLLVFAQAIILCTPVVRAIITYDRVFILGNDEPHPLVKEEEHDEILEAIQAMIKVSASGGPTQLPFELRALESILTLSVRGFAAVVHDLQQTIHTEIVPHLRIGLSPLHLSQLLEAKRSVEDCLFAGRALQSAISAVLGQDEDLAALYLTDKFQGSRRAASDHQRAELLLEYIERRLDEVNESLTRLRSLLLSIDSNISLALLSTRVRLQILELQTAIGALSLASGTCIAGFFGQNLISGFEDSVNAFYISTGVGVLSMVSIATIGWVRLYRAKRAQLGK